MGRKGFSAVGLAEILSEAGVPKGSFYHYFESKDAFGEALIDTYFGSYLSEIEALFSEPDLTMARRLMIYLDNWQKHQVAFDMQGRCLAVKLGAEVSDLSEAMRLALKVGTDRIIARLATAIDAGVIEGSVHIDASAGEIADTLYQQWLGASVMAKIHRTQRPFATARSATCRMLEIDEVGSRKP